MTEEEKELSGKWLSPFDPELSRKKCKGHRLSNEFNRYFEEDVKERSEILKKLIGSLGENVIFIGPIFFHYGCHTKIGDRCFFNMNLTVQDDANVTIGNDCRFGPNCTIVTPSHPMAAEERRTLKDGNGKGRCYCKANPVTIGDDCWFGANVTVLPGVRIGSRCVIGAGSVVTKDIPDDSVAYGVPCKVARKITAEDSVLQEIEACARE